MPPLAYVVPTAEMEIKAGKHVDVQGRIYLPFLTDWRHVCFHIVKHGPSLLLQLLVESPHQDHQHDCHHHHHKLTYFDHVPNFPCICSLNQIFMA
jgi:hypothetical protein